MTLKKSKESAEEKKAMLGLQIDCIFGRTIYAV
jgi:hypothetical protein